VPTTTSVPVERWTVILDPWLGFLEPSAASPIDFRVDGDAQAANLPVADFDLQRRSSAETLF
jgi:hypothetical protein